MEKEPIIVAIELGSSKIAGIAGKLKDGTMQIIAYAEDHTSDCMKRGVIYNIEKTTQSIKNVIARLETTLKVRITKVYIGLAGQSLHSVPCVVKRNMQTPTCINQTHIDDITLESHDISIEDYEFIDSFPQKYVIDSNEVSDPVGVVGTELEGHYLNIVANRKIRNNIITCFDNTDVLIEEYKIQPCELAANVLTETERRSGTAVVDFGAATTTIVVYKNNIIRLLSTIPLGFDNIRQDLCSLQLDDSEAETLLLKYGTGSTENTAEEAVPDYTTSDGRQIKISEIRYIIEARLTEILTNVAHQLGHTEYATQLLGGMVLTGGGANMPYLDRVVTRILKIDKIRTAHKLVEPVIKNSTLTNLSTDSTISCGIISLLLSGEVNCVSDREAGSPNIFDVHDTQDTINQHKAEVAETHKIESEAIATLEAIKGSLREAIVKMQKASEAVTADPANKRKRTEAEDLILQCTSIIDDTYDRCTSQLIGKDKYKMVLKEAEDLIAKRDEQENLLSDTIKKAAKQSSLAYRLGRWLDNLINEAD